MSVLRLNGVFPNPWVVHAQFHDWSIPVPIGTIFLSWTDSFLFLFESFFLVLVFGSFLSGRAVDRGLFYQLAARPERTSLRFFIFFSLSQSNECFSPL